MRVHATLHGGHGGERERDVDVPDGASADELARALAIEPETVIVFRDGEPIPGDEPLADGDRVRVLRVVSGGGGSPGVRAPA